MEKKKTPACRSFAAGKDGVRPWEQISEAERKELIKKRMQAAAREAAACLLEEKENIR